ELSAGRPAALMSERAGARRRLIGLALASGLALAPSAASAQIFIASKPAPGFTIGPLTIRASVDEAAGPVRVDVLWSIVLPPDRSPAEAAQDIYLLWPGEIVGDATPGQKDAALAKYVEAQGFDIIGEGRLPLLAQSLAEKGEEVQTGGAPFVTFVQ